jgi:hypothetical protein
MAVHLCHGESMADDAHGSKVTPANEPRLVIRLRDPLGIARGMAESIPDLVDELHRLATGPSASSEIAVVVDELTRTAHLIETNISRALVIAERYDMCTGGRQL